MFRGKQWKSAAEKVDRSQAQDLGSAINLLKEVSYTKFDGTVEAAIKVGYKSLQNVRGTLKLPHGTGKAVRVLVIAKEDKHAEAKEAGADFVGAQDMIDKIQSEKWTDFDACVATPDMMKDLGKLGPILGRKGLMPKPKAGTVTEDVAAAVKNLKGGQLEYKADKSGVVHLPVGKVSFSPDQLQENIKTVYQSIMRDKPSDAKGEYVRSFFLAPTMGPGVRINTRTL
ncbi:MAG TPA: 50S ribosomal protein L1 [Leptospiraceae bacterium]|nr:50S ribosomal protein L1 [Spirochaetaceae bacterium]HBS06666.1 50S ribosomal protein L1 [Leptospiraceae bacterium]|tara:strand:+ start:1412 stop:2092 length:681 start_codon:yes stop_codon:yes gene_type:complete